MKKRFYYRVENEHGIKFVYAENEEQATTKINDKYDSESYRWSFVDLKAEQRTREIEEQKNQRPVKQITISITWKKSRMWGYNPHCKARVEFQTGFYETSPVFSCSGCGYDKESTVIADVFNYYLKYKLHKIGDKGRDGQPYGISFYEGKAYFEGGIGTSCYTAISKHIGGTFETVATGDSFDVYRYTDNN